MKLEEAKSILDEWAVSYRREVGENDDSIAIETVLQELDNSVSKDKAREEIKELSKKLYEPNNDRWEKDDNNYYNKIKAQIKILKELLEDK